MHLVSQARHPGAFTPRTALALVLVALAPALAAATGRTLYPFVAYPSSGTQRTGVFPSGTLVRDATGALFGATSLGGIYYNGTVFKLTPPAPGRTKWTLTVLYTFPGGYEGGGPNGGLVRDARGALYGTAETWGWNNCGVVFKLTPPRPGTTTWTRTVLHTFLYHYGTGDGCNPGAGVIRDATGALYGTTMGGGGTTYSQPGFGTVFKLTPPAPGQTTWQETVLYRFAGGADGASPMAKLTADGTGALYGTTVYGGTGECHNPMLNVVGCGTVFKLTPPRPGQTTWRKRTLYRFRGGPDGGKPQGKLLRAASGALYGTTLQGGRGQCTDLVFGQVIGCGTVFAVTP
jgi:hypothetical protein